MQTNTLSTSLVRAALVGLVVMGLAAGGYLPYLAALTVLLTMVLLHEGGHFAAAKLLHIDTPEFFVGFGPKLFSFTRNGTEYGLKAFPIGGYVRIAGMTAADKDVAGGYGTAPWWKKAVVVTAGPGMNIVTALVAIVATYTLVGIPTVTTTLESVTAGSPAAAAGIAAGDTIVAVDGEPVTDWTHVSDALHAAYDSGAAGVTVDVRSVGGSTRSVYVPFAESSTIGVNAELFYDREPLPAGVAHGVRDTWQLTTLTVGALGDFVGKVPTLADQVANGDTVDATVRPLSPIGILQIGAGVRSTGEALMWVWLFSVYLGIFNMLPILPLDGGHLAVATYEKAASLIARRRVEANRMVLNAVAGVFVAALIVLTLVAVFLDITQPVKL